MGRKVLKSGKVCRYNFLKVWELPPFCIVEGVLERNVLLLVDWLVNDRVGFFYYFYVLNFLDFRFNEKLVLLFVHYFIYYIKQTIIFILPNISWINPNRYREGNKSN